MILYAHQINDWKAGFCDGDITEKVLRIIKSGLHGSNYGSSDGTLNRMGSVLDGRIIDKILDYDYHGYKNIYGVNKYPTAILAFPRKIDINGECVDFTSSPYTREHADFAKNLSTIFNKYGSLGLSIDSQFVPKTWLDVIYGFRNYSVNDNLFIFNHEGNGVYNLVLPNTHWIYQDGESYAQHKQDLSNQIERAGANLEKAIVDKAQRYKCVVDEFLNEI